MKTPALLIFSLALLTLTARADETAQPNPGTETRAVINPDVTWGVWEGWGASLAWWGKAFGNREDLADVFFTTRTTDVNGERLPGLGFNIVRYNAGACAWREFDGRRMIVSTDILPYRQIEGFWIDARNTDPKSAGWDWSVDANQRAMLLMARDRGADRFELFSNSPMWWMCRNDNPSGGAKATDDNLDPAHYANFAHYLAAIARHAEQDWGISFTTVSPFNEPTSKWWHANGKQEGCHVSAPEQIKVLPLLRAALDAQGLAGLPIAASDESFYDEAVATWKAYTPEAKALVTQVNVHGYQGAKGNRDALHRIVRADGKRLWNSEHGDKDPAGLELAQNLHRDFARLHPTAWCYWQPVDGGRYGKGGSGWGLIDADMNEGRILKTNTKFFVLAHYARHIRPGMIILDSGDPHTVAAYDAAARRLVLVSLNENTTGHTVRYDLGAFTALDGRIDGWLTEITGDSRYKSGVTNAGLKGSILTVRFPARSVQTLELRATSRNAPKS